MKTKLLLPLLSLILGTLPLLAELEYFPKNKDELLGLIKDENVKLDEIDTSKITDMSYLFCQAYWYEYEKCENSAKKRKDFSGIETWDVSNVENMEGMFLKNIYFNEPIGQWNVSKVKNMHSMFQETKTFNQPLNSWNVGNVKNMEEMFAQNERFNQTIDNWNVSKVKNMRSMFEYASSFNQPLNSWNVSNVENMERMFYKATSFNQPLDKWNVSNVKNMKEMFYRAKAFNQPLNSWKLNKQANTKDMFRYALTNFNQNLDSWGEKNPFKKETPKNKNELLSLLYKDYPLKLIDVSQIKDMSYLFCQADLCVCEDSDRKRIDFSGIESWDVSNVENMEGMFFGNEYFNEPLKQWNVAKVKNMKKMFFQAKDFNQSLSSWDIRKDANTQAMLLGTKWFKEKILPNHSVKFIPNDKAELLELLKYENLPLSSIDTSKIVDMSYLFCQTDWYNCRTSNKTRIDFSGIETWDVSNVKNMKGMFEGLKNFNQDLSSWGEKNPLKPSVSQEKTQKQPQPQEKPQSQETNQCEFEEAFNLIGIDEPKAIKLFSKCLQSSSPQKEESKIYLAYLYLNQEQPDIAKGSALAVEYAKNLYEKLCSDDKHNNFCQDYGTPPDVIDNAEMIFPILYFGGKDFSYGMIPQHPQVLHYTQGYYGSSRDSTLGDFVGDYPKPFKSITIDKIFSAKNSYKLTEFLAPLNYDEGTMRFYTSRNRVTFDISLNFCPQFIFENSLSEGITKDISPQGDEDTWFFGWFYVTIKENPDLLKAYNECIQEIQEYYQNVLKLPPSKAKIYAKKAVHSLLLNQLL